MATQSILRNGIMSPARAMLKTTSSTKSILKRPGELPLSPAVPLAASFSVQVSPLLQSPHVQFLPSPSLVSIFTAHSVASYDRAPISVSPLERVYVTPLAGFKLSAAPKSFRSIGVAPNSPAIRDFEDPRSPKLQPAAKQNALHFAAFTSSQTATRPSQTLSKSLASYPRSPYPSAPLTTQDRDSDDIITPLARASSLELPRRNRKGLTLAPPPSVTPVTPPPVSLDRSLFSPSMDKGMKVAPLDLESRLSQAFWEALSLEAEESDDEVMVTALEYPSSAVEFTGKMDQHTSHPQIMYADAHGALWSPGLPKPGAVVNRIRESLMSPGKRSSFSGFIRKDFTAPTPNDPFAAFPSFASVIEMEGSITYPSRVLECGI
jgi:hypothetical protein